MGLTYSLVHLLCLSHLVGDARVVVQHKNLVLVPKLPFKLMILLVFLLAVLLFLLFFYLLNLLLTLRMVRLLDGTTRLRRFIG